MAKKEMPAHIAAQRARGPNKKLRRRSEKSEFYDVFRRINMHNGDKTVCWEWGGAHGLGTRQEWRPRVVIGQKHYYVHRIVHQLYTGYTLQTKDVIRHTCDNSWCCNPHHMIIGTQADNVRDMLDRERVGIKQFHVKRIMQMLEMGCDPKFVQQKMREGYDMQLDVSVIRKIRMRTIYKHIEWKWGDEYRERRHQRLLEVRSAGEKLASDLKSAIITDTTTATQGDNNGINEDEG